MTKTTWLIYFIIVAFILGYVIADDSVKPVPQEYQDDIENCSSIYCY